MNTIIIKLETVITNNISTIIQLTVLLILLTLSIIYAPNPYIFPTKLANIAIVPVNYYLIATLLYGTGLFLYHLNKNINLSK